MRKTTKASVRCLLGLAVAAGLVTLLSPLPFTSSNPRLKGSNPAQPHPTHNPFSPTQAGGEESKGGNGRSAGGYKENAGVNNENSGEKVDGNGTPVGNNENTGGNEENQGRNDQTIGENGENSGGNQKNTNVNGNTGENDNNPGVNQVNSGVNEEITGTNSRSNQPFGKLPVEEKVEEEEQQEELEMSHDSYIQNLPPKEWVEVEKIKPKEKGGGGGKESGEGGNGLKGGARGGGKHGKGSRGGGRNDVEGGGKRQGKKKKRLYSSKKSLEPIVGFSPKVLQERAASLPESSPVRAFVREQSRRVAHVADVCRAFQPSLAEVVAGSRGPPVGLLAVKDIIYDRKNMLTFCPVYKAASTSWTITMLELAGHWTTLTKKQPLQKVVKMFYPKLTGMAAASMTTNTTHFMVVRHPLERLLSCYRDKYQLAAKDYYYHMIGEKIVRLYREALKHMSKEKVLGLQEEVRLALIRHRNKYGEGVGEGDFLNLPHNPFANPVGPTFLEFAQYVAATKNDDEHWRSYAAHCAPCILAYDFVLRFESLQEETKLFLEYLNRTGEVAPRWDNYNRKAETGQVFCQYYSQLPLELIDRLVEKYKKDLMMYEYDAEDYRKCAEDYRSSSGGGGEDGVTTVAATSSNILLAGLNT